MAYGRPPFVRDYLDVLIDRRLRGGSTVPLSSAPPFAAPETVLRRQPISATPEVYAENTYNSDPIQKRSSPLKEALAQAFDTSGQQALAAGIAAGRGGQNFGGSFLDALSASLGTGAQARGKASADEAKRAMDLYGLGLEERRTKAQETTANRPPSPGSESTASKLEAERKNLEGLGLTPDEIKQHFMTKGVGGSKGRGPTDLDKVAQSLVDEGRAKNLSQGYVMARTLLQQPQLVGSVERTMLGEDASGNLTQVTRRVNVHRRIDPQTGMFQLIDDAGNVVGPEERQTFMGFPMTGDTRVDQAGNETVPFYSGGAGGPANPQPQQPGGAFAVPPPAPPQPAQQPAGPLGAVPSHAPMMQQGQTGDFVPGPGGFTEEQIMGLLQDPRMIPETLRTYAAGRGPAGNSTLIKALAAQRLRGGQ